MQPITAIALVSADDHPRGPGDTQRQKDQPKARDHENEGGGDAESDDAGEVFAHEFHARAHAEP